MTTNKTLEEAAQEYLDELRSKADNWPIEEDIMNMWRRVDIDVDTLSLEDVL